VRACLLLKVVHNLANVLRAADVIGHGDAHLRARLLELLRAACAV
jgi:hypothetical protein